MLKKNIEKQARKSRPTWIGYSSKMTPTKKTRMYKQERKHRNKQALSTLIDRAFILPVFRKFSLAM